MPKFRTTTFKNDFSFAGKSYDVEYCSLKEKPFIQIQAVRCQGQLVHFPPIQFQIFRKEFCERGLIEFWQEEVLELELTEEYA